MIINLTIKMICHAIFVNKIVNNVKIMVGNALNVKQVMFYIIKFVKFVQKIV